VKKAWVNKDSKQVKKVGWENASWRAEWLDLEGKRRSKAFGPGPKGQRQAEKYADQVSAQLLTGTYQSANKKTWQEFRAEYESKQLARLAPKTRISAAGSLDQFERIIKPKKMSALTANTIVSFAAARRQERGKKVGSVMSPASVNHDLRNVKAALNIAQEWGFITAVPKVRMEREPKKLPVYMTDEHFAQAYCACDCAKLPDDLQGVAAGNWWRALLVMLKMTGWRISETLSLKWDDVDLDAGVAITRAEDNKGKRDERVDLHPVVVEQLRQVRTFDLAVFPWNYNQRTLNSAFLRLQEAAGIRLPCTAAHKHTRYCYVYGFHDLRRAFATMNADRLNANTLQVLMRHKDPKTTQGYIALGRQMKQAVASLHVPDVLTARQA
jgi:integrase